MGALPVPAFTNKPETPSTSCDDINNCRTLWSIILGCLTTVFLCTWVAIHPNIPEPVDTHNMSAIEKFMHSLRTLLFERVPLFVCMLFIPDYVLAWAIRQRLVATQISRNTGWSKTHGFFIIMGGFYLFKRTQRGDDYGEPVHPLTEADVIQLFGKHNIEFPVDMETRGQFPAEVEIQDRSKSDWLAKSLVIIQTLWFIVQCIARGFARLPVTKLELVTLAYTAMNLGVYLAWWHKPYDVTRPIRIFTNPPRSTATWPTKTLYYWKNPNNSKLLRTVEWASNCMIGSQDKFTDIRKMKKVPAFYSGEPDNKTVFTADAITLLMGLVFGAIHLIGWSFEFSSYTELRLWRLSSVTIIGVPLCFTAAGGIQTRFRPKISLLKSYVSRLIGVRINTLLNILATGIAVLLVILYIASRLTTLVLAFTTLRSLPLGAYQAIQWTNFIPHF